MKRSGPKMDSCGTPLNNSDQELKEVFILVLCHLSVRYDLISIKAFLSNPYAYFSYKEIMIYRIECF